MASSRRKSARTNPPADQGAIPAARLKEERAFLDGIPRFNLGAFLLPPVWGPIHGFWVSIIFYPLWLVADNCFVAALAHPSPLTVTLGVVVLVLLVAITVAFSIVSQPIAWHRAAERGMDKQTYLKRQRMWAVICAVIGAALIAAATYYNLVFDPIWYR